METLPHQLNKSPLEPVAVIAKRRLGRRPSPGNVWRWCRKGVQAGTIKLAAVFHDRRWLTTAEAFDQFLLAQTHGAMTAQPARALDLDSELAEAGLL